MINLEKLELNKYNMNISFKERVKIAKDNLSKQKPVTLEEAIEQAEWLKNNSKSTDKKK